MLRVIGAGFPRTGTSSMKAALDRLGFGPCHHMFTVMGTPGLPGRWAEVPAACTGRGRTPVDWSRVFAGFASAVDWPASFFWRELSAAYPQAKVVLTVRDPRRWYASARDTVLGEAAERVTDGTSPALREMTSLRPVLDLIWRTYFGTRSGVLPDETTAIGAYERHNARVRAEIPQERLLVYELGQGWEPLCRFLGVDIPADEPFPHLNDTASTQRRLGEALSGGAVRSPFTSPD
ncbi:sulfotransferase family protein [Nocardiopsis sediminis]|uniref:Sulfotransferase family protein n=1 Tax=Nocardiopsis sediminis TaxID=1778267 RepID=A0ABV8FHM2_9ACTN